MCRAGDPVCVLCVGGDGIKMCGVPEDRRWIVGVLTSVLTGCTQPFYSVLSTLCPFEPFLPGKRLVSGGNGQHSELARREKHMIGPRLASSRALHRAPQRRASRLGDRWRAAR